MKYKLINPPNNKYSAKQQILINRGISIKDLQHYLNLSWDDVNDPEIFGEDLMDAGAHMLMKTLVNKGQVVVIVDSDCDGYTSSAVLLNYIYDMDPEFTENNVHWFMHDSKQHGLQDAMEFIDDIGPDLVIVPDAGSNDELYLRTLEEKEINVLILDHHEVEIVDFWRTIQHPYLILINSQSPQYPNKELSGVGVVWQFCRYIDKINGTNYANWYLDLVALGLTGDMVSLRSFETRQLIFKGLDPTNIHNPFIYYMWQKNKFKLGDNLTSWGATFYIVPLVNAITRSGTFEEKELIFKSMLKFKALEMILSNKRGHKAGEQEKLIEQAIRTCTNVKNRQTRAENAGLELVEHLIKENNMMDHKVLLFLLEPGQIQPEIRGLIANKLMARYQRPCCILTHRTEKVVHKYDDPELKGVTVDEYIHTYEGSARGCDKVGVTEFKDICAATRAVEYVVG